jgi:uncharacterized protein YihD (DUF1040 family)
MRDPNRIPRITAKFSQLWERNPDLRLGQLVYCIMSRAGQEDNQFNVEDDKIEPIIDRWLREEVP